MTKRDIFQLVLKVYGMFLLVTALITIALACIEFTLLGKSDSSGYVFQVIGGILIQGFAGILLLMYSSRLADLLAEPGDAQLKWDLTLEHAEILACFVIGLSFVVQALAVGVPGLIQFILEQTGPGDMPKMSLLALLPFAVRLAIGISVLRMAKTIVRTINTWQR